ATFAGAGGMGGVGRGTSATTGTGAGLGAGTGSGRGGSANSAVLARIAGRSFGGSSIVGANGFPTSATPPVTAHTAIPSAAPQARVTEMGLFVRARAAAMRPNSVTGTGCAADADAV